MRRRKRRVARTEESLRSKKLLDKKGRRKNMTRKNSRRVIRESRQVVDSLDITTCDLELKQVPNIKINRNLITRKCVKKRFIESYGEKRFIRDPKKELNITNDVIKSKILDMKDTKRINFLMKMKRSELVETCTKMGYQHIYKNGLVKGYKKDFVQFLMEKEITNNSKKKIGRPLGSKKEKKEINSINVINLETTQENYGLFHKDYRSKWVEFILWKRIKTYVEYPQIYEDYLLFFFSNKGWSGVEWNKRVENLIDQDDIDILNQSLPHKSYRFPSLFRNEMKRNSQLRTFMNVGIYDFEEDLYMVHILSKSTKVGSCCNRFCQKKKDCHFIHRFSIQYYPKTKTYGIDIYVKGQHGDDFCFYDKAPQDIPISIRTKWNRLKHSNLYKGNLEQFREKCTQESKKEILLNSDTLSRKQIYNHRYRLKTKEKNTYIGAYEDILRSVDNLSYRRFFVYEEDIKENLYISFIVNDSKTFNLPNNLDVIYFDGTFKAKMLNDYHYNILMFATLSKDIHKLVPLGFVISFSSTHVEYMNLWKGIEKYYSNKGYTFTNTCFMSDVGSAEIKFASLYKEMFHFYCWYHVKEIFEKWINLYGKKKNSEILNLILLIYASKTISWRADNVKKLKMVLGNFPKLTSKIWKYFRNDEMLNKWTCLAKLSVFRDHSNNYLEVEFKSLNEKTGRNQTRITDILEYMETRLCNIELDILKKEGGLKIKSAFKILKKGYTFLDIGKKIYRLSDGVFNVESSSKEKYYKVSLKNYYCTCLDFNLGRGIATNTKKLGSCGRGCKHLGAVIILFLEIEKEMGEKDVLADPFQSIKFARLCFVHDECLKWLIENSSFPLTIGEDSFIETYR